MLSIKQAVMFFIVVAFSVSMNAETLSGIMKTHDKKIAQSKKYYESKIKKISSYTIKRLEQLKQTVTRAGKLKDAIAIQNEINKLQGKDPITMAKDDDDDIVGGVPSPPGDGASSFSAKSEKKFLKKRYVDFFEALIANKYDKALGFLDPAIRRGVDKNILKGHLRILGGALQSFQVRKGGVGVERIRFTKKLKEAKVSGKLRSSLSGTWEASKDPSYWIYKHGEWYLGDDKKLKKLF